MPFKKGQSGNPIGRPKGSLNKVTLELRERIKLLLDDNFELFLKDFKALDAKNRINTYIKLLEYCIPKLQRSEGIFDLSKLSEVQLNNLFESTISKLYENES